MWFNFYSGLNFFASLMGLLNGGGGGGIAINGYEKEMNFIIHDISGEIHSWKYGSEQFSLLQCDPNGPISYVLTGFREDGDVGWAKNLIQNLRTYRGGCVILVDYWKYTKKEFVDYPSVVNHYDGIVSLISNEIMEFSNHGFSPANIFIFGFSYGGQLALGVGRMVKDLLDEQISRIDVCEPTSVGFASMPESKLSAEHVRCIHTNSLALGTRKRDCHQDWNLGKCGFLQELGPNLNTTSHWLCPTFYNSAFLHDFPAIPRPSICAPIKLFSVRLSKIKKFKMGFMETRNIPGEFYARTSSKYPYN